MSGWAGWRDVDLSHLGATPISSPKRGNKYNARKVTTDGQRFDSAHEAKVYQELRCEEIAGQITDLRRQRVFPLIVPAKKDNLPTLVGQFTPDFTYRRAGQLEILDAKSKATATEAYRLRKKLFEALYGLVVQER